MSWVSVIIPFIYQDDCLEKLTYLEFCTTVATIIEHNGSVSPVNGLKHKMPGVTLMATA
jgi:hypothetical protein